MREGKGEQYRSEEESRGAVWLSYHVVSCAIQESKQPTHAHTHTHTQGKIRRDGARWGEMGRVVCFSSLFSHLNPLPMGTDSGTFHVYVPSVVTDVVTVATR